LQMLRREKGAFGPDDRLKLAHGLRLKLAGGARKSQKRFNPPNAPMEAFVRISFRNALFASIPARPVVSCSP
jgi:hypothetical protein